MILILQFRWHNWFIICENEKGQRRQRIQLQIIIIRIDPTTSKDICHGLGSANHICVIILKGLVNITIGNYILTLRGAQPMCTRSV
jgi:hypothetical protein